LNKLLDTDISPDQITSIFGQMTSIIFDQIPIPINFLDAEGRVIVMNQAFLDFLGLELKDVEGKHLSEIDHTVRLPIIIKTGHAEIGHKHRFKDGRDVIVHRIPLFYNGVIIGGVGIILIEDLSYLHSLAMENKMIRNLEKNKPNKAADVYKSKYTFDDILTMSKAGKDLKTRAESYAKTDFPVLITGESGIGKELLAHSIHSSSSRKNGPFIRVNCAAIPETLIESELFGYEKGAFTGAQNSGKTGKFELAHGGTIFLDEIGELPINLQAKFLRVLQEKEMEKLGSNEIVNIDIRVIAATNSNLEDKIKANEFRQDLYYRLNVLNLNVPSLKERKEDIPLLVNHFITSMNQNFNIYKKFTEDIINILINYSWPGNVRELKNVVERIAVNASDEVVKKEDIPDYILQDFQKRSKCNDKITIKNGSLKNTLAEIEKKIILDTLKECNHNQTETAQLLGIPRMTLYRKLKSFVDINE